jgi:hypothetical protein
MKKIFLFLIVTLTAFVTRANVSNSLLFSLNTIYIDRDYDNNGSKSQNKITDTDLRLLRIEKQWAYGGIYSLSSNDSSDSNRTNFGLTGGFYSEKDFYFNAHYFFTSKYSLGGGTEYTKGSGYGIDLGFISKVTSSFFVGLVICHRSFTYTEQTANTGVTSISVTHKELLPLFTFAVLFQ